MGLKPVLKIFKLQSVLQTGGDNFKTFMTFLNTENHYMLYLLDNDVYIYKFMILIPIGPDVGVFSNALTSRIRLLLHW